MLSLTCGNFPTTENLPQGSYLQFELDVAIMILRVVLLFTYNSAIKSLVNLTGHREERWGMLICYCRTISFKEALSDDHHLPPANQVFVAIIYLWI